MAKLVWRLKLVAELNPGIASETELARIERDDFVVEETLGLTLDEESMQSRGDSCRSRGLMVGIRGTEVRIPPPERTLKGAVQNGGPDIEERLHCPPVPAHLLLLDHPARDDLIDRAFDKRGRNGLAAPAAGAIIHQGSLVRFQIDNQILQVTPQGFRARGIADGPCFSPVEDAREFHQTTLPAAMPEAPFRALDIAPGQLSKMSIGRPGAEASRGLQDMLKTHGDVKPVQHDRRARQHLPLQMP